MIHIKRKFSPRERILAVITALVVVGVPTYLNLVRPAVDDYRDLRHRLNAQQAQYAKLQRNLAAADAVDAQITALGAAAWQQESDEVTLSSFLGDLELLARRPTLRIVGMNPLAPKENSTYKLYPVRLTVAGRGPEVVQFVAELTNGKSAVGLNSFSVRGVQGGELIECTLNLWLVKLKGPTDADKLAPLTLSDPQEKI